MNQKTLHEVETRLTLLHSYKSWLIAPAKEWDLKYIWQTSQEMDKYKSNYATNTIFSIINAKASEILTGIQEYDFIPLDDEALKNVKAVKKIWEYEWLNSKTDKQLANVVYSSLKKGDWFMYEWIRRVERKIKTPILKTSWEITFEEENIIDYDGIYCEYIPWENIYFDGDSIDWANEAIWIKHWDRQAFINSFELNPNYNNVNDSLPKGKYYYISSNNTLNVNGDIDNENIISELRYYNKSKDQLIILANGIEVCNMAIPYKHKELPFCKFEDYKVDGRFYSMWEYELLEKDEAYKDALRALSIDVIKAQFWFTVISPDADFDEATIEIGTNSFARLDPRDISHFSPNINASSIQNAEAIANEDIIIKSWIDFRSQVLWANETATKTAAKTQSARKRINLNLKLNGYSFFERLARLRMSNLQLLYSTSNKKIPIKWWSIDGRWVFKPLNGGYGTYTVKPEHVIWAFNIIPITESILGISSEREKTRMLEFASVAWNIIWPDGKPVINPKNLVEEIARRFGVDFEKLTGKGVNNKSAEDILKEVEWQMNGNPVDSTNPMSSEYIPPEQRSWAKNIVPVLWSSNNNMMM